MAKHGEEEPSRMSRKRAEQRQASSNKPSNKKGFSWRRLIKWIVGVVAVLFLLGVGLFAWYAKSAPALAESKLKSDGSSIIYAANGDEITTLGLENRVYVSSSKIPTQLKQAVVSIEDRHFYSEKLGIDPLRIAQAALSDVTSSGDLQGASTLTQQLVKLSYFSTKASDQTIKRKAQEAWLAFKVERSYSKSQILEFYINKVYMNHGQYGMATAAKYYYNKSLSQLTLAQTAFIAGLAQAPSSYDPVAHPEAATNRRNQVINAMLRDKEISSSDAAKAKATNIGDGLVSQSSTTKSTTKTDKIVDSYLTGVIKEVKKKTGENPYTSGMKIYTNLDMNAQTRLYDIVNSDQYVNFPDNKFQTAVTMTDPNNGAVLAQIGGRKTGNVRLAYNRAIASDRSNGSTMKPILDYGPAIEYLQESTATVLDDSAYNYPGTNTAVNDWDNRYDGKMTMRKALEQSRNIPAVKTLAKVG